MCKSASYMCVVACWQVQRNRRCSAGAQGAREGGIGEREWAVLNKGAAESEGASEGYGEGGAAPPGAGTKPQGSSTAARKLGGKATLSLYRVAAVGVLEAEWRW